VSVGDAITVQVLRNEVKAEQPIAIRLKIVGLSSATEPCVSVQLCREIALWRSRVMEFNEARHRFELPDAAQNDMGDHRAVLFARSEAHVKPLVQKLRERGYQTEDRLQEMEGMRHLSVVLTAFAGFFVFGFVVMSLITVMVTTLMHVQAKQHEIGILRGLGLSWTNVLYIYVLQGLFIGAASFVLAALLFALTGNGLRGFVADLFSIKDPVFTEGGPFSGGAMLYLLAFAACLTVVQSCLGVVAGCWRACRMLRSDALRHRV
jgi:predicted lysophospholipase L1 biosynthesis ABC-type transport system permease subunit